MCVLTLFLDSTTNTDSCSVCHQVSGSQRTPCLMLAIEWAQLFSMWLFCGV